MYGLLYECKFLTIEETNKKKKKKKKKKFSTFIGITFERKLMRYFHDVNSMMSIIIYIHRCH